MNLLLIKQFWREGTIGLLLIALLLGGGSAKLKIDKSEKGRLAAEASSEKWREAEESLRTTVSTLEKRIAKRLVKRPFVGPNGKLVFGPNGHPVYVWESSTDSSESSASATAELRRQINEMEIAHAKEIKEIERKYSETRRGRPWRGAVMGGKSGGTGVISRDILGPLGVCVGVEIPWKSGLFAAPDLVSAEARAGVSLSF